MITNEHISLLSERYMIDAKWVRQLRDMHFLWKYVDAPVELHPEVDRIHTNLEEEAWQLTQAVFSNATRDDSGLIWINGEWMAPNSEYWWYLLAQKAEETKALKNSLEIEA